jgi:hypothetical protein
MPTNIARQQELGTLIHGWSGKETEVEGEFIKPLKIVKVKEKPCPTD